MSTPRHPLNTLLDQRVATSSFFKIQEPGRARKSQEEPGQARRSQEAPRGARTPVRTGQEERGAAMRSQGNSGKARRSSVAGGARRNWEEPGGTRRSQEESGGARRSQGTPGEGRRNREEPGGEGGGTRHAFLLFLYNPTYPGQGRPPSCKGVAASALVRVPEVSLANPPTQSNP